MDFLLDISLLRVPWWIGTTVSELSHNSYGYKNTSEKTLKSKCLHAESDLDNDSDQTLFPKFIVLESMDDNPTKKLSKKFLSMLIKLKSIKKINPLYPAGRNAKKSFSNVLEKKYFHNLKTKSYADSSLNSSKVVVRNPDLSLCVKYSHNKYSYIHMYMFLQHHNGTINNQTDAQW